MECEVYCNIDNTFHVNIIVSIRFMEINLALVV